jgi:transcriptional regulator with XRE-family HTH domain
MVPKNSNIKDVARRAGVSIATVSHVVNNTKKVSDETRRKVLKAIEGLHYQPNLQARSLRTNQNLEILILIETSCLVEYNVVAAPLLAQLVNTLNQGHAHVTTVFFDTIKQALLILKQNDYYAGYVISSNSFEMYRSESDFPKNVTFVNLNLEGLYPKPPDSPQLDIGSCFYHEIDVLTQSGAFFQVVMNYRQGNSFKHFSRNFDGVRLLNSEIGCGSYYLEEILRTHDAERILFADYALFIGAIKCLLLNEDVLYSNNLQIEYLSWSKPVETYGLPVTVHTLPVDAMVQQILARPFSS